MAARQREPYRYSMCCLRTFCILLLYNFMPSQYTFYNIMHYVKYNITISYCHFLFNILFYSGSMKNHKKIFFVYFAKAH